MARKTKAEAELTRKKILASALDLFADKGYDKTTFIDIAARLDMTKGAVYWHFESKEALIVALVEEMFQKFERQISSIMPKDELTFTALAETMVKNAKLLVEDAKGRAFFLLMKTQIRWGLDSMKAVREKIFMNKTFGPWHAFIAAVENDIRSGRARKNADPEEVANMCVSVWDGMVQSKIDGFLRTDMCENIRHAFAAIWDWIKEDKKEEEHGE